MAQNSNRKFAICKIRLVCKNYGSGFVSIYSTFIWNLLHQLIDFTRFLSGICSQMLSEAAIQPHVFHFRS
jgi:hypothetical protein